MSFLETVLEYSNTRNDSAPTFDFTVLSEESSFIVGSVLSEISCLDMLLDINEQTEAITKAENSIFEKIKIKVKEFLQKAIDFFTDLNVKINNFAISKLSKLSKKEIELNKDIDVFDSKNATKISDLQNKIIEFIEKIPKPSGFLGFGKGFMYGGDFTNDLENIKKEAEIYNKDYFKKNRVVYKAGTRIYPQSIIKDLHDCTSVTSKCIDKCKNAKKEFEMVVKGLEKGKGTVTTTGEKTEEEGRKDLTEYAKLIVSAITIMEDLSRKYSIELISSARAFLLAGFGSKKVSG